MADAKVLPFTKMHGLGNDFVVIDDFTVDRTGPTVDASMAKLLCYRRLGVGADQLLWLKKPQNAAAADARMEVLNADGSAAEMCGNGIRAIGLYLKKYSKLPGPKYRVETGAGVKLIEMRPDGLIQVDMGQVKLGKQFKSGELIRAGSRQYVFHEVNVGNPHAVILVPDAQAIDLEKDGPVIETNSRFPQRTNVEFVQVVNETHLKARVWERGAGATLACGTGACASAVAALALNKAKGRVKVALTGGELEIEWNEGGPVYMTGPAVEVFRGDFSLTR
jgi:diaminopimelate epimerase